MINLSNLDWTPLFEWLTWVVTEFAEPDPWLLAIAVVGMIVGTLMLIKRKW